MPSRILYNLAMIVTVPMKYTIKKKKTRMFSLVESGKAPGLAK